MPQDLGIYFTIDTLFNKAKMHAPQNLRIRIRISLRMCFARGKARADIARASKFKLSKLSLKFLLENCLHVYLLVHSDTVGILQPVVAPNIRLMLRHSLLVHLIANEQEELLD